MIDPAGGYAFSVATIDPRIVEASGRPPLDCLRMDLQAHLEAVVRQLAEKSEKDLLTLIRENEFVLALQPQPRGSFEKRTRGE